jgi:hypothetical protein
MTKADMPLNDLLLDVFGGRLTRHCKAVLAAVGKAEQMLEAHHKTGVYQWDEQLLGADPFDGDVKGRYGDYWPWLSALRKNYQQYLWLLGRRGPVSGRPVARGSAFGHLPLNPHEQVFFEG